MSAVSKFGFKALVAIAVLAASVGSAHAVVDVAGAKFEDSMPLAGKQLVLNGAGVRTKYFFKLYAAGLYLPSKESTTEGVMKAVGPRRIRLIMLKDISSDAFGAAFMSGMNDNVSKEDQSKIISQISKYGEAFALLPGLKKGDIVDTDWTPGVGSQPFVNGKKIGEVLPDVLFYNSVLRIWLGEKPADAALKVKLLGPVSKQ